MSTPRTCCRYLFTAALLVAASGLLIGCGDDDNTNPSPVIDTTPPAAPSGLAGTSRDLTVEITWNPNQEEDLASYYVYEAVDANDYDLIAVIPAGVNTFTDQREIGHDYSYQLEAVDTSENTSEPSAAVNVGLYERPGSRRPIDETWDDDREIP
jgi:hypothetical protein